MHYNYPRPALLEMAGQERFQLLSINTEVPFFPSLSNQQQIVLELKEKSDKIDFITTFSTSDWDTDEWSKRAIEKITAGLSVGGVGVKCWKNIGMTLQDGRGEYVMIDHPSFDRLFAYLEQHEIPVLGHLGEPRNCWLPLEKMTVASDREYFSNHPEYHMHHHPECPSYEEQLEARDRRLEKHPELRFVGAHLASLEWSVDRLAEWLDRFPNAAVDLAERICHLQYQAVSEWEKVREFVHEYQDRIIYGTDLIDDGDAAPEAIQKRISEKWHMHWRFFSSGDEMTVPKVSQPFRGLNMEDEVLEMIFRKNALRWYPRLNHS